ncbi:MAG: metabolite traffic protein EboE [Kiritimatiellaeota bacterium]|nr:metabolite traffic protein EboE [Kiritimatiellota bacterium]
MELPGRNLKHLTYCLNIHAGETWPETFDAVRRFATAVRERVSPDAPFGLGLRLSARAAAVLERQQELAQFTEYLERNRLYVFTVNGFPYGRFHGAPVKERVYAPDWRTPERLEYSCRLGRILCGLLPDGVSGSISTVPGGYRARVRTGEDEARIRLNLGRAAMTLARLSERTGRQVRLALEPEPDCLWERTDEICTVFAPGALERMADLLVEFDAVPREQADAALKAHLGVCFDTCHQATQFESVGPALAALERAGVPVAKVQVSASPAAARNTPEVRSCLAEFADSVYLHQVRARLSDGQLRAWPDLDRALEELPNLPEDCEVRTHVHIPLSVGAYGPLGSTRRELDSGFFGLLGRGPCPHIEIETYTFSVLPSSLRREGVVAAVASEFEWLLGRWREWAGAEAGV